MENRQQSGADLQQRLAEERTEGAHQRTILAQERTFTAWSRTGLASMATGFAIAKLMGEAGPAWLIRLVGALFIVSGGFMLLLGFWDYRQAIRRLARPHHAGVSLWAAGGITLALLTGGVTVLALLFLE